MEAKGVKLMSMRDYALMHTESETLFDETILTNIENIRDYAKFLGQPIKLGDFIPCDSDGVPLEAPIPFPEHIDPSDSRFDHAYNAHVNSENDYDNAKDKCIFVGCELRNNDSIYIDGKFIMSTWQFKYDGYTDIIEDLLGKATLTSKKAIDLGLITNEDKP